MLLKKLFIFFLLVLVAISSPSCGKQKKRFQFFNTKTLKIALVLPGPVNDSSWNAAAYSGLKRFQTDYNSKIAVVEKVNLSDASAVFSELAERKFDLILAHGYEYGFILQKIAEKFPKTFFCVVGGEVSQHPNLCSVNFKDEQYGYLVGVVAGLNTSTNKVGIVVGKKMPSIERAIIGIRKGLRAINPKADLVVSYINSWNDIAKGREAAISQANTGVDIITHLADTSGIGVIKAAEEADISAIGAVTDQHDLAPSTIITSGIEDASQLIYLTCENYVEKDLEAINYNYGLKEQVVDLAPSYGNIDPTTETRINRIKSELTEIDVAKAEQQEEDKKKKSH
ncbi:MAG: BMP family protein [Candidatus Melainabacteria bacterium]|nr:BMP family protein [Candidatus Melainabacteria bacterium]